jgi:LytR cell envelope-related transcriptional attenuator
VEFRQVAALAALALTACAKHTTPATAGGAVDAPAERVRVEVVNATKVHGLARRATRYLRAKGFDVVASGTAHDQRDSTLIVDRTNHPVWAGRVARAFGGARVQFSPDSSRYVDITVLLGQSWRPPAEPFYP